MTRPRRLLATIALALGVPAAAENTGPVDVVVVGAGIAGLVAAYELRKGGLRVQVLEAEAVVGGRVATADYGKGLYAEFGMQEIWAGNPLLDIATELALDVELGFQYCAHSSFMADGKIYPDVYDGTMRAHWDSFLADPERQALEGWLRQAKRLRARAQVQGLGDSTIRGLQDLSFEDWVRSADELSAIAGQWLRLHVEAELASDWSRFSALYALLEMDKLFDGGAACYAIDGGNSRLISALAAAVGSVTTSARVTAIRALPDAGQDARLTVTYMKGNKLNTLQSRRVVLAVPFYRVQQISIEPALSAAHHAALRTLQMAHYVVVHLVMDVDAATLTTRDGIDIPDAMLTNGPLGCIYGVVAENEEQAIFSLLIYGDHARAFHSSPTDVKVAELLEALDAIQPGFSGHVDDTYVYTYHPAAIARFAPGRSPLDDQAALLREPVAGVYLAGDYTLGGHSDSAARSGISAATRIIDELAAGVATNSECVRCAAPLPEVRQHAGRAVE